MAELSLVRGDITLQETDAIVNAANAGLAEGGGVCGAMFAAAGRRDLAAACRAIGRCPVGDACTTPGFALRARWIIHAVGPRWTGGHGGEPELLAGAYRAVLREADAVGARSVATPILSSGIFGYPLDDACRVAVETLRDTPSSTRSVSSRSMHGPRTCSLVSCPGERAGCQRALIAGGNHGVGVGVGVQ